MHQKGNTNRGSWPRAGPGQSRLFRHPVTAIFCIALAATAIICLISPSLSSAEFAVLDYLMSTRPPRSPHRDIALVVIGREDIEHHNRNRPPACACEIISHSQLGEAIMTIKRAGAKVVALDLAIDRRCPVGTDTSKSHDRSLIEALNMPGSVVLSASSETARGTLLFDGPAPAFVEDLTNKPIAASPLLYSKDGITRGVSLLQIATPALYDDETASSMTYNDRILPPLSLAAYAAYVGQPYAPVEPVNTGFVRCTGLDIPILCAETTSLLVPFQRLHTCAQTTMLINWAGPPRTFEPRSLSAVLQAPPQTLRQWFAERIVIIGTDTEYSTTPMRDASPPTSPQFVDHSRTSAMTRLEIHANALDTLLTGRFIRPMPIPLIWLLMFILSVLSVMLFMRLWTWFAVAGGFMVFAILGTAAMIAIRWELWLYLISPALSMLLAGSFAAFIDYAQKRHEASQLNARIRARDAATQVLVHDLKQPLSAISALASVMRMKQKNGCSTPEMASRILAQVERALADIDDLLTTNPDTNITLDVEYFNIVALVEDLAITQAMRSSAHSIRVHAVADDLLVKGDPQYIGRALSNVFDNAMKYWPEGGTILVDIRPTGDYIEISVIDRGIGIRHDKQSVIFEPFIRGVEDDFDIQGTGIGLYSVKRIIEAHDGSIKLESELGVGTIITLRLPAG